MSRVVAGIGLRPGCEAAVILHAVADACAALGRRPDALAAPAFRRTEPGPIEAARHLGVTLLWIEHAALHAASAACITRSEASLRATGIASVSEACAIAAVGLGARLLAARVAVGAATCALAEAPA